MVRLEPAFYPSLALDVTLAPGWVRAHDRQQLACVLGLPVPVGVFEQVDSPSALVAVSVSALPFEVGIADWCRFRFLQARWSLASSRFIDTPHGRRLELVGARDTELGPRRRRDISFLHGKWLVQIHVVADPGSWSRSLAAWSIIGDLTTVVGAAHVAAAEPSRITLVPGTWIRFDRPASWTVEISQRGAVDLELIVERVGQAWIHLRARPRRDGASSLLRRGERLRRELVGRGFEVGQQAAQTDHPGNDAALDILAFESGCVIDAARPGGPPHDVRLWHRRVGDHDVDAMLVAPPPGVQHLPWMRAIRAFEIAFGSARIGDA